MNNNKNNNRKKLKWSIAITAALMLLLLLLVTGCSAASEGEEEVVTNDAPQEEALTQEEEDEAPENDEVDANSSEEVEENPGLTQEPSYERMDPAQVEANELGQVMVLMYHHVKEPEEEWSRTPENFRGDLEVLYEQNFRPVRLIDYARGHINVPAGTTPVVLTFDDGNDNNFSMIEDERGEWVIDPDSAVGVLMAFHEEYPDFRPHATFFINGGTPFGQADWVEFKLNYLVEHGMDIGNHTETHLHLGDTSTERLQQELARIQMLVDRNVDNYIVNTFSLPFGSRPKDEEVVPFVIAGEHEGVSYKNEAVLEVGWDPYHSPFHKDFNPHKIRRIRASETKVDNVGMYDWLATFESGGRPRYISDGDPKTIAIPENRLEFLTDDMAGYEMLVY